MKAQGYKFAVAWIAENDNPGDREEAEIVEAYPTVALVADIYGKDQSQVAKDVIKYRNTPRP